MFKNWTAKKWLHLALIFFGITILSFILIMLANNADKDCPPMGAPSDGGTDYKCTGILAIKYYDYYGASERGSHTYVYVDQEYTVLGSILFGVELLSSIFTLYSLGVALTISYKKTKKTRLMEERNIQENNAKEREKARDYDSAITIWEKLGKINEAARVRDMQVEMGAVKVTQKVVHGDEVTRTEIKDSVLNRSNVGGFSKMDELEKLTEMKKEGLISEEEYEKMKQEIIG